LVDLMLLQAEHKVWLEHNFPRQLSHEALLGVVEEVGELSHSHLKKGQGIRGTDRAHVAAIKDAIGDIVIYLASYCTTNGYDLDECVEDAWALVMQRDWQDNKVDGSG